MRERSAHTQKNVLNKACGAYRLPGDTAEHTPNICTCSPLHSPNHFLWRNKGPNRSRSPPSTPASKYKRLGLIARGLAATGLEYIGPWIPVAISAMYIYTSKYVCRAQVREAVHRRAPDRAPDRPQHRQVSALAVEAPSPHLSRLPWAFYAASTPRERARPHQQPSVQIVFFCKCGVLRLSTAQEER